MLGAGGFGVVAEVFCRKTYQLLAVKITSKKSSDATQALQNEKHLLTEELSHPNIIKVKNSGENFTNYLIMEMELGLETL